jgi:lipopolysaccharide biosynthesis glycosyltransferase
MSKVSPNSPVTLVFCFDRNFANYAAVATFSAFKNKSPDVFLKIYWVVPSEDLCVIGKLKELLRDKNLDIILIKAESSIFSDWKTFNHVPSSMYLRLLIADLIDEDKVIYLDCDLLVLQDIGELFTENLGTNYVAGVVDSIGGPSTQVPGLSPDSYINTGVMLMNLKELRKNNFLENSIAIHNNLKKYITWGDQCVINKFSLGKKTILDKKWNYQIVTEKIKQLDFKKIISDKNVKIVHFLGAIKPWQKWCNPVIFEFWWEYAKELDLPYLQPQEIEQIQNAIQYAEILHFNESYSEASEEKTHIIEVLCDYIKKNQSTNIKIS